MLEHTGITQQTQAALFLWAASQHFNRGNGDSTSTHSAQALMPWISLRLLDFW